MIKIAKDPLNIIFSQVSWTDLAHLYFAGFAGRVASYVNSFQSEYCRKRFIYSNVRLFKRSGDDKDVMIYDVLASCSMEVFRYLHGKYNLSPKNELILLSVTKGCNVELVQWLFDNKYQYYYFDYTKHSVESIKFMEEEQLCQTLELCKKKKHSPNSTCVGIALGYKKFKLADKLSLLTDMYGFDCPHTVEIIVCNGGSVGDIFKVIEWLKHNRYDYAISFITRDVIEHGKYFGAEAVMQFLRWAVKIDFVKKYPETYYGAIRNNNKKLIKFLFKSGVKINYSCLIEALKAGNIDLANWILPKCSGDTFGVKAYIKCKDPKKQIEVLQWAADNNFAMPTYIYGHFADDIKVLNWLWQHNVPIDNESFSTIGSKKLENIKWLYEKGFCYSLSAILKTFDVQIVKWYLENSNKNKLKIINLYEDIIKISNSDNINKIMQMVKLTIAYGIKIGKMDFDYVLDKTVIKKWQKLSDK
jgi:hypothetical protein